MIFSDYKFIRDYINDMKYRVWAKTDPSFRDEMAPTASFSEICEGLFVRYFPSDILKKVARSQYFSDSGLEGTTNSFMGALSMAFNHDDSISYAQFAGARLAVALYVRSCGIRAATMSIALEVAGYESDFLSRRRILMNWKRRPKLK